MVCLDAMAALMPQLNEGLRIELGVPMFRKALQDKIPNVQFCACKRIKEIKHLFNPEFFESVLLPELKNLTQGTDKDVAFYAMEAINASYTPN